jgi:hypothetical protein
MKSPPVAALEFLVVGMLATGMAPASDHYSQADAERYIKPQEAAWAESVASNDASVVKRIRAHEFVWVERSGTRRARSPNYDSPSEFLSDYLDYRSAQRASTASLRRYVPPAHAANRINAAVAPGAIWYALIRIPGSVSAEYPVELS